MNVVTTERNELAGNLLTIGETCNALRLSRSTLYGLLESGRLESIKIPGTRCRRVPRAAVEKLLADGLNQY